MFQNHIGINLTESKFQFVEVSYKHNSFYLENVDQVILKESLSPSITKGLNSEHEVHLISILQDSFNKIISKKKIVSKYISFSLPHNFFIVTEIPFEPTLTRRDLIEQFKWELSILYPHLFSENFLIQHIEVNKTSIRTEDKAIIFAIDKSIVSALNKFCNNNNLKLRFVDNAHLSSIAFLRLLRNVTKDSVILSFYIDQSFSSFMAIEGTYPFYFKMFNTTKIFDFFDEIIFQLSKFGIDITLVNQILISGQSITDEVIIKIEEKFNCRVLKINPFEKLKVEEEMKKNPLYTSQYNSFTAATGMAIRIV
ncbi:MAG: hypothetical protein N2249_06035 [Melioribacter sp.]|nr:hypothetical protein [Melioribacter sp.]